MYCMVHDIILNYLHFSMEHLQVDLGARHLVDPNCLGLWGVHLVLDRQIYVWAETLALEVLLGDPP